MLNVTLFHPHMSVLKFNINVHPKHETVNSNFNVSDKHSESNLNKIVI